MSSPAAKQKLESIEAARGVAASLVVVYHAARHLERNGFALPWFGGVEKFGHAGVDFFFVLSGFIILFVHHGDLGRPGALLRYAERRCTRIYPLYWAILAVYTLIAIFGSQQMSPDAATLAANTVLYPLATEPIVGVAWTLQHEMLFYVLFAAAIVDLRLGLALVAVWLALIAGALSGVLEVPPLGLARVAASAFNVQFVMGMLAALIAHRARVPQARLIAVAGALSFAAIGVCESQGVIDGYADPARFLYGAAAFAVVVGLVEAEREARVRVPRLMGVLGKASYSIYLGHLLVLGVAYKSLERLGLQDALPVWLLHIALVVAGIGGGVVFSMTLEYPLMGVARKLWGKVFAR
ncbi:MAG: acyltransferase [Planctomycetes bacterium]|nr:acyltransferase [Planctomycetota bacterium]